MSELIVQYVQNAVAAATPWLAGAAVGFVLLWLVMFMREKCPFAKEMKWFSGLAPLHRFIVVCALCFFTLWGGSKERNGVLSGLTGGVSSALSRVAGDVRLRTLPEIVASNAFAVTDFAVDSQEKAVAFEIAWATNLFADVDSRNVDLFMSTNLSVPGWLPVGRCLMPSDTNSCAFAVTSNDVIAACRSMYVDSFSRMAFFRFGLDFDSDGDGLSDAREVQLGTSLSLTDTDHDGLSDALEDALNLNALQPDSDGDGMNDGWEYQHRNAGFNPVVDNATDGDPDNDIGADPDVDGLTNGQECEWGTNPGNADSDGDGVNDGAEIGQSSDPTDPRDGGQPNTRISVPFYFGDPSGSQSEKYRLEITPVSGTGETPTSFSWLNESYGECETKTAMLKAGWKYEVRLYHAGTNGSGSGYPDYDYELDCASSSLPSNVVVEDPESLFGTDYTSDSFAGAGKVATITVFTVTGVTICKPDDSSWTELEESRVVLDDEELRIKIEIAPQVKSLAQCRQAFGDSLTVKTAGTCPTGASVPIGDDASLVNSSDKSEIRISKIRQQLISLGLLPSRNDDEVNEMAWYDIGDDNLSSASNLADSRAFAGLGYQFRGQILKPIMGDLDSNPPVSMNSESFYKSAGCEIITAHIGGVDSKRRQIMNQADYFYYSGHGRHSDGSLMGLTNGPRLTPSLVSSYWNRDLKCVVFAGCSVLDINDYNGKYAGTTEHTSSPGKLWSNIEGPMSFLGYANKAPLDTQGADRIATAWVANRGSMGDVDAWMNANDNRNGRNACAIDSSRNFHYFKKSFWKTYSRKIVPKGDL